jgi:uncharacterized membrane protein (DUF4010 family)
VDLIPDVYLRLGVSLGLGLLVGLQRELGADRIAGVRTFALITLLGTVAAMLASTLGPWIVLAALLAVGALVVAGALIQARREDGDIGLTTEVAALVMFGVGALLGEGDPVVAIVVGGLVAVLLQAKGPLHALIARLADKDVRAIFQFVLITLVILPVVPDETFGPYDVLNPRNVWLMVVLVVGISLGGYLAYKVLGQQAGTILGGVIGGLISSTATTASYAKRVPGGSHAGMPVVIVVLLATAIMYVRVLIEIGAVARDYLWAMAWPILVLTGACVVIALIIWLVTRRVDVEMPEPENPTELKPALLFAVLYAVVLLLVAWARDVLGDAGTYAVAAVSGVADMDAITLSTGRLVDAGSMDPDVAWRAIVVGSLSNMAFKAGIAWALGGWALAWRLGAAFGGAALAGLALLLAW